MDISVREILVEPDAFRVAQGSAVLVARVHSALAVCLHDDTQAVGGILHLRYAASHEGRPIDLTDNILSSSLLLMDRFCKDLRQVRARQSSWRVRIVGHAPDLPAMEAPAATVIDLVQAYFAEGRRPVECQVFRRSAGLRVQLDAGEGRMWVSGALDSSQPLRARQVG